MYHFLLLHHRSFKVEGHAEDKNLCNEISPDLYKYRKKFCLSIYRNRNIF